MDSVDACVDDLRSKLTDAATRISQLEADLDTAKGKEEAVHHTLLAATKTNDELIEAAQKRLEVATAEAQEEADRMLSEAQYEAFRMITEATENSEAAVAAAKEEADRVVAQANEKATRLVEDAQATTGGAEARAEEIIAAATQRAAAIDSEHAEILTTAKLELDGANEQARSTLADARAKAEDLVIAATSEAKSIIAAAKDESADRVSEARKEAMAIVRNIEEETNRLLAEREAELAELAAGFERDHAEISQRLVGLRALAARIENEMQLLGQGGFETLVAIGKSIATEAPGLPQSPVGIAPIMEAPPAEATDGTAGTVTYSPDDEAEANASFETYTTTYRVPLAPMTSEPEPMTVEEAVAPRASRYSRRSANLPRLGDAAGGILSAVGALRNNSSGETSRNEVPDDGDGVVDLISA